MVLFCSSSPPGGGDKNADDDSLGSESQPPRSGVKIMFKLHTGTGIDSG